MNQLNNILVDADRLRNNNSSKQMLMAQITDILRSIKEEIRDAFKSGLHEIRVGLPITFALPNMSNADAQRMVWGSVIDALIKKNYRVRLYPKNDKCTLHITWLSNADESEIEHQNKLIANAMQASS